MRLFCDMRVYAHTLEMRSVLCNNHCKSMPLERALKSHAQGLNRGSENQLAHCGIIIYNLAPQVDVLIYNKQPRTSGNRNKCLNSVKIFAFYCVISS
jgi:hypothetical protein